MRGDNPLRKLDPSNGLTLDIQGEPFLTIQGEGPHAGLPATFIRLWGCHLRCTFCDTDFESNRTSMTIGQLLHWCAGTKLVVLTGGEPMRQNIVPLVRVLTDQFHTVQVETAGSFWWEGLRNLHKDAFQMVVSPKTTYVHVEVAERAVAWKYIIDCHSPTDMDGLPITSTQGTGVGRALSKPLSTTPKENIYLQPMDAGDPVLNTTNTTLCVKLAQKHGYRVSLQQHKILGLP